MSEEALAATDALLK